MNYETMQTISAVLYIAGAFFAAEAVILFFRWRIIDTILSKTGIAKKRAKARMEARMKAEKAAADSLSPDLYESAEEPAEEPVAVNARDESHARPDILAERPFPDTGHTYPEPMTAAAKDTQTDAGRQQETPEGREKAERAFVEAIDGEENTGLLEVAGEGDEDTGLLHTKKKGKQFRIVRAIILAHGGAGDDSTDDIAENGNVDGGKGAKH